MCLTTYTTRSSNFNIHYQQVTPEHTQHFKRKHANHLDTQNKCIFLHFATCLNLNTFFNKTLRKAYTRLFKFHPLINRKTPLKYECTALNINKTHNYILITHHPSWFKPNTQMHKDTNTPTIKDSITTVTLNLFSKHSLVHSFETSEKRQFTHF